MTAKVFITGASSGLGAALARAYARRGATLGLLARRRDALVALASSLNGSHRIYAADVNDTGALRTAALAFQHEFECPDIVIANAGISHGTATEFREDLAVFEQILHTNILAAAATFQPFIEAMKARRSGTLVLIASVAGVRGLPGAGAYSASKAAAIAYAESLRLELAPHGIRVVTLAPGYVDTPMTRGNPYPMPFLIGADDFARRALRVIARGRAFAVIPWPMAIVARVLRLLPIALYDRVFARAPRKPRLEALPARVQPTTAESEGPPTFNQEVLNFGADPARPPGGVTVWQGRAHWPDLD